MGKKEYVLVMCSELAPACCLEEKGLIDDLSIEQAGSESRGAVSWSVGDGVVVERLDAVASFSLDYLDCLVLRLISRK